jgi:hypothetical protein
MASIGRLVTERADSKRRLVALESELERAADSVKHLGSLLKLAHRDPSDNGYADPSIDAAIDHLPTQLFLANLLAEIRTERQKYADLSKRVSSIGL